MYQDQAKDRPGHVPPQLLPDPAHQDGQAFSGKLIKDREHPEQLALMGPGRHEVVRPDMVLPTGPQSDARSIIEPESSPLGLLLRHLKPFPSPDAFNSLVVDPPAIAMEQRCDSSIAVPATLRGVPDDRTCQRILIIRLRRLVSLSGARLADHLANTPLGDLKHSLHMIHAQAATGRA